jgi:ABC-2 type transport system ATP-binding protein
MATPKTVISVMNVSKSFRLPHEKFTGIKQAIFSFKPGKKYDEQTVLDDISFNIKDGEFFGIVGRNGSGKSTLLKLLAQIYVPNAGTVDVQGSLTPFIELGVGFNSELTGRENIYLNGALLGFDHDEVDVMYQDIVGFAELEHFMDQKLKNYSSGMQVRLAFSIAIRAKSDILLIDEVLAVGDEAFQKKCIRVFEGYKAANKTVVLVTHDMSAVERFCDRAMLIENGKIVDIGDPHIIGLKYTSSNNKSLMTGDEKDLREVLEKSRSHASVVLLNAKGEETNSFKYGERATVNLSWKNNAVKNVGIALVKTSGEYVSGSNTFLDNVSLNGNSVSFEITLNIGEGEFGFKLGFFGDEEVDVVEFIEAGPTFMMKTQKNANWRGLIDLEHTWS